MPVIVLFGYIVLVALLGYLSVWVLGQLSPGHPVIIDNVIWVVVVVVVVLTLLQALGLYSSGPTVPRFGR